MKDGEVLSAIGARWVEKGIRTFLLSARFSLLIAMAEIGVHLDLITLELEQQIILLAVITATFSPILFRIFRSKTP